jgi:hypothetical protein
MTLIDGTLALMFAIAFKMFYMAADPFQVAVVFFLALIYMKIGESK